MLPVCFTVRSKRYTRATMTYKVGRLCSTYLGTPAVHRLAEVLTSADEDGEQYQDGGRVLAIQSVDQVVVEVVLEVAEVDGGFDETVHLVAADERASAATNNSICV